MRTWPRWFGIEAIDPTQAMSKTILRPRAKERRLYLESEGDFMTRFYVDCRDYPSEMNCTVAISADTKPELVDAAVQHAVAVHGHHDSPQLREQLAKMIKSQ